MKVIDFHAHAFPDTVAEKAMPLLESEANVKAPLNGTLADFLRAMDRAGVVVSVLSSIATKPTQFEPILQWSKGIASDRIVPFPSVHPADPEAVAHVHAIAEAGFKGLKLHPYYQEFCIDEDRMIPIYEAAAADDLIVLCHAGFDIAFPRDRIADPVRTAAVLDRIPGLKFVAAHVGAWEDWDEVEKHLIGKPVYMDVSYSLHLMDRDYARRLLMAHPMEYILFGTDAPWADPAEVIAQVQALELGEARETALLYGNGARLLGLE